jgi:hypothetical protein
LWAGTVYPSTDAPTWASAVGETQVSDFSGSLEMGKFEPSSRCCDIAFMDTFRANRLLYVQNPEFVEAVRMVASGDSKYSPKAGVGVPFAAWKDFAMEMRRHSAADTSEAVGEHPSAGDSGVHAEHSNLRLVSDSKFLIPALFYLASLEYRSWPGNEGTPLIFPRVLRDAVAELENRLAEKRRMAEAYAKRAAAIAVRIAEAERTVARNISPDELARAKSELERARRNALGVRSNLSETDTAFAQAEKVADGLLRR